MQVGTMTPGTMFCFRGKVFLRVGGPWEDDEIPTVDWTVHPMQVKDLCLAVLLSNGALCPFFRTQEGEVQSQPIRGPIA